MGWIERRREAWRELEGLVGRFESGGVAHLAPHELLRFGRLYRATAADLALARAAWPDPSLVERLNSLAIRAHAQLYRPPAARVGQLPAFLLRDFPRATRALRPWLLAATCVFLGAVALSFFATLRRPELAAAFFDPDVIEFEGMRLERQVGEYKGNFTFTQGQSSFFAALIIANNIRAGLLMLALGLLGGVPGLFALAYNGFMVGTLLAVTARAGYFGEFCARIGAHGVIELSTLVILAACGLRLATAPILAAPHGRGAALVLAGRAVVPVIVGGVALLVLAGLIEGFVTPHAPLAVRLAVAAGSAIGLTAFLAAGGRATRPVAP